LSSLPAGGNSRSLSRHPSRKEIPRELRKSDKPEGKKPKGSGILSSLWSLFSNGDDRSARRKRAARPSFLPMVQWFPGASSDILITAMDQIVTSRFFQGRFDARVMQASIQDHITRKNKRTPGDLEMDRVEGKRVPRHGDGILFEHFAERKGGMWLDFMADTGDGGHPTYSVARCLAQRTLYVSDPHRLLAKGGASAAARVPMPKSRGGEELDEALYESMSSDMSDDDEATDRGAASSLDDEGGDRVGRDAGTERPRGFAGHLKRKSWAVGEKSFQHLQTLLREQARRGARRIRKIAAPFAWRQKTAAPEYALPRGDALMIGGDLAYPNPTEFTYEKRLFLPFQDALPPPPHYHPTRLVVTKPDLPPNPSGEEGARGGRGPDRAAPQPLRDYDGPQCFAIPGNHDWIDGLETFQRHFQHKGWLGGWTLPQGGSYFALHLPHGWWVLALDLALVGDIDMLQFQYFATLAEARMRPGDRAVIITHEPIWHTNWFWGQRHSAPRLRQLVRGPLRGRVAMHLAGDLHFYMRHSLTPPDALLGARQGKGVFFSPDWLPGDPLHLVTSGSGGAFLHPTHVFDKAEFPGAVDLRVLGHVKQRGLGGRGREKARQPVTETYNEVELGQGEAEGTYKAQACFPDPGTSRAIALKNMFQLRSHNQMDIWGGAFYCLIVLSIMPLCGMVRVLDAPSLPAAGLAFLEQFAHALGSIFAAGIVSPAMWLFAFLFLIGFARSGGAGCMTEEGGKRTPHGTPAARKSGMLAAVTLGGGHAVVHLVVAVTLLCLVELGIELCIRYEQLGRDGYHSLFRWYQQLETRFGDPYNIRGIVSRATLGLYPNALKWSMTLFDLPESVAVSRARVCRDGLATLSRIESIGYHLGTFAYFWLFAAPASIFVLGCYLALSVGLLGTHFDEGFSSLRVKDFKGFVRIRISEEGDMEVYSLGMKKIPTIWAEDPRWVREQGAGHASAWGGGGHTLPSHHAEHPSRWVPVKKAGGRIARMRGKSKVRMEVEKLEVEVVDYFKVPKPALR